MERYRNIEGNSGITAFELGKGWIKVQFKDGVYLYTTSSTGLDHIRNMQQLAIDGKGLGTYISQHVGTRYACKEVL
jgi:hypothetical protein